MVLTDSQVNYRKPKEVTSKFHNVTHVLFSSQTRKLSTYKHLRVSNLVYNGYVVFTVDDSFGCFMMICCGLCKEVLFYFKLILTFTTKRIILELQSSIMFKTENTKSEP